DEANLVDVTKGAHVIKYIRRLDFSGIHPKLAEANIQVMSDFSSRLYGKQSEIMQMYPMLGMTQNEAAEIDNLV
ncbi:glycerate kinase, partial [Brevibacterium casei]